MTFNFQKLIYFCPFFRYFRGVIRNGDQLLLKKKFSFDELQCFYFLKEFRTKIVKVFFKFRSYERSELQAHIIGSFFGRITNSY